MIGSTGGVQASCRTLRILTIVTALVALTAASSESQTASTLDRVRQKKVVVVGISNEPPFTIALPGGKVTGESPEVMRAILAAYGVDRVEAVVVDFAGLIPALLAKRFDVIAAGMYIRPARCEQVAFANPHLQIGEAFAVKKGNPKKLHSYADVAKNPDAVFGTEQGAAELDYARIAGIPPSRIVTFPDNISAMKGLQAGRVDAIGLPPMIIEDLLKKLGDPNLERARPFTDPLTAEGKPAKGYVAAAFRKEDADFRKAYNAALEKLHASGRLLKIVQPFGFTEQEIVPSGLTAEQACKG